MKDDSLIYNVRRYCQSLVLKLTSKEFVSKLYFSILLKEKLNLNDPQTFNEKVQWLKLYYCSNEPSVIQCADKYAVREYIKNKGYGEYLNELYDVWENEQQIEWDKLPQQFVLKCNHGCGYNIVCDDKNNISELHVKKKLKKWMKEDFGLFNAEPHYDKMPKRIISEKHLGGNIIDYKFFCFDGEPMFMYIAQGFGKGIDERITFFDMEGNKAPYRRKDYEIMEDAVVPKQFEIMKKMCRVLSEDFPFVRVDLFEVENKIYFSELTFTPCGGLMKIEPKEFDRIWGKYIYLGKLISTV